MPDLHVFTGPDEALVHQCTTRLSASLPSPVVLRVTSVEQSFTALEELDEQSAVQHIILVIPWSVSVTEWLSRWRHTHGHRSDSAHRLVWVALCLHGESIAEHLTRSERVEETSWAERTVEAIETVTTVILKTQPREAVTLCRALNPKVNLQVVEGLSVPAHPQLPQPAVWTDLINEASPAAPTGAQYFTFTARRPFHKERLSAWLREPLSGLTRVGGFFWVADFPHIVAQLSVAGSHRSWKAAGTWWIGMRRSHWPTDPAKIQRIQSQWHPDFGDRLQALGCVGIGCDPEQIQAELEACLLQEDELDDSWTNAAMVPNPFP